MREFNGSFLLGILFLLGSCTPPTRISEKKTETIKLTEENTKNDSSADSLIAPYRLKIEKEMNEVLGISDTPMVKGLPESLLGNFVADLVLERGRKKYIETHFKPIDFCMLNNGGLRTSLPKGPITKEKVFELMPFENELVVLTLSGAKTMELLSFIAKSGGVPVSGISLHVKNEVVIKALIGNIPFDPEQQYRVITSDYLAGGGDKMSFFSNPLRTDTLHYLLRDAIIDHIKKVQADGQKLSSKLDGRISYE